MVRFLKSMIVGLTLTLSWVELSANESIKWYTNYDEAVQVAKSSSKPLLLLFTGSDWCTWCIKLEQEVFHTPDFARIAGDKFVFVKLDFPMNSTLPQKMGAQNKQLQKQFSVAGFPTVVILDAQQQRQMGSTGYRPGGGKAYADYLLGMIGSHHAYLEQIQNLDRQPLPGAVLKKLYTQALELQRAGDINLIVMTGMESDEKIFFMLEHYKHLADQGQLCSLEAKNLQQRILEADPDNRLQTHYELAVTAFEALCRDTACNISPEEAVDSLVKYIEKFGSSDRENLWRLELIISQVYYEKDKIPEALQFAISSYQVAPPSAQAQIGTTIQNMRLQLH